MSDYRSSCATRCLANEAVAGVAPFIIGPVLVETQPEGGESPQVFTPWVRGGSRTGINGQLIEFRQTPFSTGTFELLPERLVVGSELARMLNLGVGDFLAVHSARSFHRIREAQQEEGKEVVLLPDDFEVRGCSMPVTTSTMHQLS